MLGPAASSACLCKGSNKQIYVAGKLLSVDVSAICCCCTTKCFQVLNVLTESLFSCGIVCIHESVCLYAAQQCAGLAYH